jgi:Ca2+-binding RTX toxin-like protein
MGPGQHGTPPSGGTGGTTPAPTAPVAPVDQNLLGDATANVLAGGDGNNTIAGLAGEDLISSGNGNNNVIAGDGADTIVLGNGNNHVDAGLGADSVFLGNGTNWVNAGAGDDTVFGGTGNTTFVDNGNDGSDTYHGGGASDTLDMSAISARIEANLGTGYAGWAKVGTETNHLYGIENIATGSGDDTITASDAHNTIDVGDHSAAGHDTVIFRTAASADGDNILNFQTGDKIDLHNMMNGTINLVSTAASAHDVAVQFDATTHGDSIITGIDEGGNHFTIDVKGHHVIGTDFAA